MDSTFPPVLAANDEPPVEFLDWSAPPPLKHPTVQEEAGLICETSNFDCFYNASGDQLVLPSGQKYRGKRDKGYKSAMSVTTHWDREQEFSHTVLDIRSPHMKAALKATVPEYSSYNIETKHITIVDTPFCLYHYRHELGKYGEELMKHDFEAATHVYHLLSYMWDTFHTEILTFGAWVDNPDIVDTPALDHKHLWMVFRPGDVVYVREKRLAFVFKKMALYGGNWCLTGEHIDFDGSEYGVRHFDIYISSYEGFKPLRDLNAIPFSRLPVSKQETIKRELVARGRRFISLHENNICGTMASATYGPTHKQLRRIVVDHTSYKSHCTSPVHLKGGGTKYSTDSVQSSITENDLMICNKDVMGYCLKDNKWGIFDVDCISNISFDSEAFDALMFPEEQKKQILSLVRVHEDERLIFDDFVKGKGRGMVFLLYGDPGTGKTLTAESISDYCKKTLLRLDASTLGTSVSSVESGLTKAFNLAEKWRAVVLIDEADIYLEQRKSKNLTHNGLVSVFLRILEYYQGILFLTTNRINSFDRAFMSRIHLALHYPPLTRESRRKLWYIFLKRASPESAEALRKTGTLDKFAAENLNGRQIKNLVRTANALALSSSSSNTSDSHSSTDGGCFISAKYIEWALQPMKQFDSYMAGVFRREEEEERNRHREESAVVEEEQNELEGDDNEDADESEGSDEEGYPEEDGEEEEPEAVDPDDLMSEDSVNYDYGDDDDDDNDDDDDDDDDEGEDPEIPLTKRRRLDL